MPLGSHARHTLQNVGGKNKNVDAQILVGDSVAMCQSHLAMVSWSPVVRCVDSLFWLRALNALALTRRPNARSQKPW
jgi:hypothetical protein